MDECHRQILFPCRMRQEQRHLDEPVDNASSIRTHLAKSSISNFSNAGSLYKPRDWFTHSSLFKFFISISPDQEMLILFMFMSLIHVQIFNALPYIPLHERERSFFFFSFFSPSKFFSPSVCSYHFFCFCSCFGFLPIWVASIGVFFGELWWYTDW